MRKPLIVGNWKLNKTIKESIELVTLLKRFLAGCQSVDIVVCPVYPALGYVADSLAGSEILTGAQDLFWEEKGAFTGEVSASLIKDAGAQYVIVGHSERRQFFHETDESVNKRAKAAIRAGLTPIVCVGETLAEREAGTTFKVVEAQLKGGFNGFSRDEILKTVIAYEPVWAIGTGKVATPQQAQEVHSFIRQEIKNLFTEDIAKQLRILYGGSVKPDNIASLMAQENIDGALVGGASLDAQSFSDIVKNSTAVAVK